MKKNLAYYSSLDYPIHIERMQDGVYYASIPLLKGCKGYGATQADALEQLVKVQKTLISMMLEQRKFIPEPSVRLEIPISEFTRIPNRKKLQRYVKAS